MKKQHNYHVYIMTNHSGTFYTGITSNLEKRIYEHKNKINKGFTSKYNINKLVYFTLFSDANQAILFEKKIKGWKREKKIELINRFNPEWKDLSEKW
jgi:putative endonuclease